MSNTPSLAELLAFADAFDWDGWSDPKNAQAAFARAALAKWGTPQPADCTRSHPHEDMSGYCLLRTEIARLANENARLKASQPVVRVPLTQEQVSEIADAAHREYDRLVSSGQCAPRWSAVFAYLLERAHGITQKGGSDADTATN